MCCCTSGPICGSKCKDETNAPSGGSPRPPTQTPTEQEQCTCTVVFRSIDIHDDGETSKGEWDLEMSVNGVVKGWNEGGVRVKTYTLNKEFRLHDCNTPITIRVGGWELDAGSSSGGIFDFMEDNNDRLSDFSANHPAPNADPSVLRSYSVHTANATGAYTIHYEILRTCKVTRLLSYKSIFASIKAQHDALTKFDSGLKAKTEEEVLDLALRRLGRSGWRVIGVIESGLILEGYQPVVPSSSRSSSTRRKATNNRTK